MGDGGHHGTGAGSDVVAELAAALRRVVTVIGDLAGVEPEQGYHRATELLSELKVTTDALAAHRAVAAWRVAQDGKLSVAKLATHLSTPRFPIGKARAGQLIVTARSHLT